MLTKLAPQDASTEKAIIGAILLEKDSLDRVIPILKPEDFYATKHELIYKACLGLYAKGEPVDIKTVRHQLKEMGDDKVEVTYLVSCTQVVNSSANIITHAKIVKSKSVRRELIRVSSAVLDQAYEDSIPLDELVSKMDKFVTGLESGSQDTVNLGEKVMELISHVEGNISARKEDNFTGMPTGLHTLDRHTGGFKPTDLVIIGARPGMGKSSLIASIMKNTAVDFKRPVGMLSMEMSWVQIGVRILAMNSDLFLHKLFNGDLDQREVEQLVYRSNDLTGAPIYIDDSPALTVTQLRSKAKMMKKKYGIECLFVDYIQLAKDPSKTSREQEVSSISGSLKAIAKELNICVVALSQLSRKVEERSDKRPTMSDLRDSGCLSGDTIVSTLSHGDQKISNLLGEKNVVLHSFDGKKIICDQAVSVYKSGHKETFTIVLNNELNIRATANHKFLTESGWKSLDNLSINERVAIPLERDGFDDKVSLVEARVIGAMIADGSCLKRCATQLTVGNNDLDLLGRFEKDIHSLFGDEVQMRVVNQNIYNQKCSHLFVKSTRPISRNHRNPFVVWYEKLGLYDVRSPQRFIPEVIKRSSNKVVREFIKSIFSHDGCILYGDKMNITYSSSSKLLIEDIRTLLQRLGIFSTVKEIKSKGHVWYMLSISSKRNHIKFISEIGTLSCRKEIEFKKYIEANTGDGWTKYALNENESICFMPIKNIIKNGYEDVFDIGMKNNHNFIANNMIVHNSLEQDADIIMFLYRPSVYGINNASDGTSLNGLGLLDIAKYRNGSPCEIWLKFQGALTKWSDNEPLTLSEYGST